MITMEMLGKIRRMHLRDTLSLHEIVELEVRNFRDATDALRALFELERSMPDRDIVLVRADTSEDVRIAFRNYFTDAREFVKLIDSACAKVSEMKFF